MTSNVVVDGRPARDLGVFLRARREHAGLTQEDLAERTGLSIRTISNLERGRTATPQKRSVTVLADALGIRRDSVEDLRQVDRARLVARCPGCATSWRLGEVVPQIPAGQAEVSRAVVASIF